MSVIVVVVLSCAAVAIAYRLGRRHGRRHLVSMVEDIETEWHANYQAERLRGRPPSA